METKKFKIKITADSASDFSKFAKEFNVDLVPFKVILGDEEFDDGLSITPDDIYAHYAKTKKLPKTAAINEYATEEFFKKFADEFDAVVHLSLSSGLSATFANAKKAAAKFENVFVVDSQNLSTGISLLILKGCEMANEGKMSGGEIAKALEELVPKVQASFVINSVEFLYKGGRCSMLSLLGANILRIKPQLDLIKGKIVKTKSFRGKQDAVIEKYIREKTQENLNINKDFCFITHTKMPEEWVASAVKLAQEAGFKKVYENTAGSTITTHCGEGTLGILFLNN